MNLGLSVLMVSSLHWGVEGVAIGTVIPMVLINNLRGPAVACRRVGLGVWSYFAATAGRWLPAAVATVALAAVINTVIGQGGWLVFIAKVVVLIAIYIPLALGVVLGPHERERVFQAARHFLRGGALPAPDEA
jgi:hypothetical protein